MNIDYSDALTRLFCYASCTLSTSGDDQQPILTDVHYISTDYAAVT